MGREPERPDGLSVRGVGEQDVAEAPLRRAVGLVAGRRGVREIVRDLVLADHLSEHPRSGDVEPSLHAARVIGRAASSLNDVGRTGAPARGGASAEAAAGPAASAGDDPENASISITYESPALGAMGFVLSLAPGAVSVRAEVAAGAPFDLASDAADELQSRLAEATGRAAEVTVVPRREPLDLYA